MRPRSKWQIVLEAGGASGTLLALRMERGRSSHHGVTSVLDRVNVRFTFDIPQGMPGEVSLSDLNNAISNVTANSSASSNGLSLLLPANPSPRATDVAAKQDEMSQPLRR